MIPISIRIECAKGEIRNVLNNIRNNHALPPCIMDGVVSSIIAEIRSEAKIELVNATDAMLREKNEELEKANMEAKKVLKAELEENVESEDTEEVKNQEG